MNPTDPARDAFLEDLLYELRLRGVPAFRSQLRRWLAALWPLVEGDPSPAVWATRWQEICRQPAGAD
jgi:hypothetical protein